MFETEVFREQMNCIEERTCDIVGTFRPPPAVIWRRHSDSEEVKLPFTVFRANFSNFSECAARLTKVKLTQNMQRLASRNVVEWTVTEVFDEEMDLH